MITRIFTLVLLLASFPISVSGQDYSSSSLNPFSDDNANPCTAIKAYPAHLESSQYIVKICAFPDQDYQNVEYKNLRAVPPKRWVDDVTGAVQIEGAKSYSTSYQEPVSQHAEMRYTPCDDGVIISYVYDTPTSSGNYISHIYLGQSSSQPVKRPGSPALSPDIAQRLCQ